MLSSDFHCKENSGLRVVPVHPGLVTSDYGVHEVWSLFVESSRPCDPETIIYLTMKIQKVFHTDCKVLFILLKVISILFIIVQ